MRFIRRSVKTTGIHHICNTGGAFDTPTHYYTILFVKHVFVIGMKSITFDSYTEFIKWKELEEEATYTTYVQKQTSYQPKLNNGK